MPQFLTEVEDHFNYLINISMLCGNAIVAFKKTFRNVKVTSRV